MAEIVVRIETREGMRGYVIDGDVLSNSVAAFYADASPHLHPALQPLVKGLLFAIRHGPLQKILREMGLPGLCKDCKDKDSEAVGALVRIMAHSAYKAQAELATPDGGIPPIDLMQKDMFEASQGMIVRAPQFDGPVPNQIEAHNEVPVSTEGESRPLIVDSSPEAVAAGYPNGGFGGHPGDATHRQDPIGQGTL